MKTMRVYAVIMCLAMFFSLTACKNNDQSSMQNEVLSQQQTATVAEPSSEQSKDEDIYDFTKYESSEVFNIGLTHKSHFSAT